MLSDNSANYRIQIFIFKCNYLNAGICKYMLRSLPLQTFPDKYLINFLSHQPLSYSDSFGFLFVAIWIRHYILLFDCVVVVFILKTGWDLLRDGMRVLLDASLDSATLSEVNKIIESDPATVKVKTLTGHNSGRYRFLEAEVEFRVTDLREAHTVSERIEQAIREKVLMWNVCSFIMSLRLAQISDMLFLFRQQMVN